MSKMADRDRERGREGGREGEREIENLFSWQTFIISLPFYNNLIRLE